MNYTNEDIFAALSHSIRLRTVVLLSSIDEVCVCELTDIFAINQPVLSKQLAQLKKSGLVTSRRQGIWMFYQINNDLPKWAKAVIEETKKGLLASSPFNEDLQHYQNMKKQNCC